MKLARVNLEAEVWGDPRFPHLERLLGYPPCGGHLAIARMAMIWGWQVEHYTPEAPCFHAPEEVIEMALEVDGPTAIAALVRARLAEETPEGVRMKGANHESTGWLWRVRQRSAAGVDAKKQKASTKRKSADVSQPVVHPRSTTGEPQVNPLSSGLSDRSDLRVGIAREAPAPGELGALVDHAVDTLNAHRRAVDQASSPIGEHDDQPGRRKLLERLREAGNERRRKLDHALTVLGAESLATGDVGRLRLGMLAGEANWPRLQTATVESIQRSARGRDGPGGRRHEHTGPARLSTAIPVDGEQIP